MARKRIRHFFLVPGPAVARCAGESARLRRPLAPKRPLPRVRRSILPVFIQLELDLA